MNDDFHKKPNQGIVGNTGFDEAGQPVPVTWHEFAGMMEPEEEGAALAALDALRRCLVQVLEGGHRDGIPARAAALGVLAGLYATPADAAKALNVAPSTIFRALTGLRRSLMRTDHRLCIGVKCAPKD